MSKQYNVFETPTLAILADPRKLQLRYEHTTLVNCGSISKDASVLPYGDFLDQCISFDMAHWESAFDQIKRLLPKAKEMDDLRPGLNMMRSRMETVFEKHLVLSLHFRLTDLLNLAPELRVDSFCMAVTLLTKPTGQALLGLLSSAGLTPFYTPPQSGSKHTYQVVAEVRFAPPVSSGAQRGIGLTLTGTLESAISTFIWHMRDETLYLHQCSVCGKWFVRADKRKSAYCGGGHCLTTPHITAAARHAAKVKEMPHWKLYQTDYNFWTQRKRRGSLTAEQFDAWKEHAKSGLKNVDAGKLKHKDYTNWLLKCRTMAEEVGLDTQADFWNS